MASPSTLKVAFLGLGSMGNAIAKNILKHQFPLTVWSRTASKADELVKQGAQVAKTPREAVANADVVVSCLFDDKSCLDVANGDEGYLKGLSKGSVHVNITTISPQAAEELTKLHEQYGAHYVAGPVLGRPDVAATGKLRSFLGGQHDAIERARPVVNSYSGGLVLVVSEKPVQATVFKLTANMILIANLSLFGQVYALTERWNIDHDVTHQLLSGFYNHPGLLAYEARVRNRDYSRPDGEGFSLEGGLKDVNAMLDTGNQVGVPLPFCSVAREQCVTAIEHGLKDMDWSALADAARINAGSDLPNEK